MYEIDEQQLRRWWEVFNPASKLVEIRLLGKNTYSGYFTNIDTLIGQLRPLLDHNNYQYYGAMQAYFTLNEVNEDLYSREQRDIFVKKPKSTTTDGDIVRRRLVLIDLDPQRSSGISASNEEFEKAHRKCVDVYRYLMENGFKEPIITVSGNGYHCYVPCNMPNDDEHNELVKRFLQSLAKIFGEGDVEIDEKVFNPARIDKLIGTWAKKGADSKERPWRISKILKVPNDLSPNSDECFRKIADLLPKEEPKPQLTTRKSYQGSGQPFDLPTWLREHNIVYKEEKQGASTRYTLEFCPWVETHSERKKWDSALFVDPQGKITFNCQHSHCKDKTWQDVRLKYEPDAYNKPPYQPQVGYQQRNYVPKRLAFQVKEELPELGKKWLTMPDIESLDLTSVEGVKTGYVELDKSIVQLNYGEVTLLSGGNASGKSSWLNSLLLNIIDQGVPTALWSGELPEKILKSWIQIAAAGKDNLKQSSYGSGKYYVPNNIKTKIDEWMKPLFYLYNNEYGNTWEQLFHDMTELLRVGVRVFILDNLMALDIDLLEGDKNNKQKELILQIKDFAKKNMVHIIMVAHPRKSMAFLRKNDISGTADLTNAVDNVFIMHRVNNDFLRVGAEFLGEATINMYRGFGNVLEVAKNRMWGIVDLMVGMQYEIESRRFKNTHEECIRYGWEFEPQQNTMEFDQRERETVEVRMEFQEEPYTTTTISHDDANVVDGMPFGAPMDGDAPF